MTYVELAWAITISSPIPLSNTSVGNSYPPTLHTNILVGFSKQAGRCFGIAQLIIATMHRSILYSSILLNIFLVAMLTQVNWDEYIADLKIVYPLLKENHQLVFTNDSLIANQLGYDLEKYFTKAGVTHQIGNFAGYCKASKQEEAGELFYAVRRFMGLNREQELLEYILLYEDHYIDKKT